MDVSARTAGPDGPGPPGWQRRTGVWLVGVAAVLALLACLRVDGALIDDAFITYRYAANLAGGRGMVYNPGERVLGTTTPGWTVLLAGVAKAAGPAAIPGAARVLNGLLLVAAGLVGARLARGLTGSPLAAGLAGALVMIGPYQLTAGMAGMESPLFNLLVLSALLGLFEGRWRLAAAAAGMAPVVRPEGALVVTVVAAAWALSLRPRRGRGAADGQGPGARFLVPAMLVVPGALLLLLTGLWYGSVVPQSVRAKQAGIYPLTVAESALETVRGLRGALSGATAVDVVPGLHLLVLAAGTVVLWRASRRLWPLAALLWGYLAFYATSGTIIFPHYLALVEPFALAAWGAALYAVVAWGMRTFGRAGGGRALALALVGAVLLLRPLATWPLASVLRGEPDPADDAVGAPMMRMAFYRAAAEAVGPAIPPGTTVLMPEIGELGFRLPRVRVLDAAGLVSPEAVPFLPVPPEERVGPGVGAIPTGLVRAAEPDLVMTLEMFARRSIYEDPWFGQRYETVWRWGDDDLVWGPLRIHARKGFEAGGRLRALPGGVTGG
ncbi:MAG: hypothetical protein PVI57_16690 [Gemmatimonadota bacterium]|jgi:hypothetical protein